MGHIKGERHEDFDRLHHPDGSHRDTAQGTDGRELDWFEGHQQAHLAKHAEREGEEERQPIRYVYTIQDRIDGTIPYIGTLADYANTCELAQISGAYAVSSSVWTWDEEGRPIEHVVQVKRDPMTEDHRIPLEYRANGETVIHFTDGAA
ncbi:hypothetical protein ACFW2V_13730 [Streptomyces sp. NPDC058947]|uniref:hypothetical protein n=1 Tax=Streptomyces sp. NPDC058947 TaxID=3346675 RepID=UPI003696CB80